MTAEERMARNAAAVDAALDPVRRQWGEYEILLSAIRAIKTLDCTDGDDDDDENRDKQYWFNLAVALEKTLTDYYK